MSRHSDSSWHHAWPVVVAEAVAAVVISLTKSEFCLISSRKLEVELRTLSVHGKAGITIGAGAQEHWSLRCVIPPLLTLAWACGFHGWGLWKGGPHALAWSQGKGAPEAKKFQSVQ